VGDIKGEVILGTQKKKSCFSEREREEGGNKTSKAGVLIRSPRVRGEASQGGIGKLRVV